MTDLPYAGLQVLEIGSRLAVGACGRLLADLGATVYLVEPREARTVRPGKWADRAVAAAGKRSVLLDPSRPADVLALASLAAVCDVVLLSTDADPPLPDGPLRAALDARPVVCDVTAFGSSGPLAGRYAAEHELQALTGVLETTGPAGGPAVPIGVSVVEMSAGMYAACGIATALHAMRRDGAGQRVEVALFDVGVNSLTTFMPAHFAGIVPRRLGNGHGMAVPWDAYPATDGWVLVCSTNDPQWRRIAGLIDPALAGDACFATLKARLDHRAEVDARLSEWTRGRTLAEAVERLGAEGIPCGSIVTLADLEREPNLVLRQAFARVNDPVTNRPVRVPNTLIRLDGAEPAPIAIPAPGEPGGAAPQSGPAAAPRTAPARQEAPAAPLRGLRVVEIGQLTTAPLAARHLASFGADVIKIEPAEGESARAWAPLRNGVSHFFIASNGEKRSLALNLRSADDTRRLAALLAEADVLVENMKPGALAVLGFPVARLREINPRLVYCAISGFGARSVYVGRPAVDTVIQAMSGMMDATRWQGAPLKTGISIADIAGGEMGMLAILAALARSERTGRGGVIDLSMQDVGAWMTQSLWNRTPETVEAPVKPLTIAEVCEHPQTRARELIIRRSDAAGRTCEVFGSPMRLSRTPAAVGTLIGPPGRETPAWKEPR